MENFTLLGTSVAANTAGFAAGVTGATFALTATVSGDSLAHKVTVKNNTANSHAAKTLALVGTDPDGKVQTETLTGPAASVSVTSLKYWLTLTSITPSSTIGADTFDIGWSAASVTNTFRPINTSKPFNVGLGAHSTSGTPTFSVQHTYGGGQWHEHPIITGWTSLTAPAQGAYTSPVQGIRLAFTVAGGAEVIGIVH